MDALALRPYHPDDAAAVAALSHRYFAPDPPWTPEVAAATLAIDALGGGRHVQVATRGDRVVGVCGYVRGAPWLYLWPLAADDDEAAGALFDAALAAAASPDLTRVKVSVRPCEPGKRAALLARGLAPTMAFVLVRRAAAPPVVVPAPGPGLRRVDAPDLDRAAAHDLHDRAFAEVDNTAPMTAADFAAYLDGPTAWPAATAAWVDADGAMLGLVIGARGDGEGVLEAIAVAPEARGRGLGLAMVAHVVAAAAAAGLPSVSAMIASTNPASLALHARARFVEQVRKDVWARAW